jgi:hypothetical protein
VLALLFVALAVYCIGFGVVWLLADALESIYPQLEGQTDLIRTVVNIYRQIQHEAFGIVLINQKNQVANGTSGWRCRVTPMTTKMLVFGLHRCFWCKTKSTIGVSPKANSS